MAPWIFVTMLALQPGASEDGYPALVQVAPGPKRYFYSDEDEKPGCPAAIVACLRKAYVVAGDQLVASSRQGEFTYVTFVSKDGRPTRGWMATAALRMVSLPPPRQRDWLGFWIAWDASISIEPSKQRGRLRLQGDATWGSHDKWRVDNGAINLGDFGVDAAPEDDVIAFTLGSKPGAVGPYQDVALPFDSGTDEDCRISLQLLGPYLLGADNGQCGGLNVTFTGIYRK